MDSDPIEDSPTRPVKMGNDFTSSIQPHQSESDFGSDAFDEETLHLADTIATVPVPNRYVPQPATSQRTPSSPPRHLTQPTQNWATPPKTLSQIQVPASSSPPAANYNPQISNPIRGIAPPGTNFRPPTTISHNRFPNPPQTQFTQNSDPPIVIDSDSDDELAQSRSEIQPTVGLMRPKSLEQFRTITSSFTYNPAQSQKNTANDMLSSYGNSSRQPRAPPQQRQGGPARALPVPQARELTLGELDWEHKPMVEQLQFVFPHLSVTQLYTALQRNKFSVDDASAYLVGLEENEKKHDNWGAIDLTASDNEGTGVAKVNRKEAPAPKQKLVKDSIAQRYSTILPTKPAQKRRSPSLAPQSSPVAQTPPPKRRRLVQGRRAPEASPIISPPAISAPPAEVIDLDSGSEEYGYDEPDVDAGSIEEQVLHAFNTCTEKELTDLVGCTNDDATLLISKRPFRRLDQVRKVDRPLAPSANGKRKGGKKVATGDRIATKAVEIETGLQAVDRIVAQCDKYTRDIQRDMKKWGFDQAKATNDGLNMVSFDDEKHDSGTGTPTSSERGAARPSSNFLKQPQIMSPDVTLKDYQVVGLNWLSLLWSKRDSWSNKVYDRELKRTVVQEQDVGCILADDMGLGKTCQVIAFLSHLLEKNVKGPYLIVVPASTMENWLREIEKFSPILRAEPYYGLQAERVAMREHIRESIKDINVIVTTYETAAMKEDDNQFLRKLGFEACIFDEGHALKNSGSIRYRQLRKIRTRFRLLLTGTPLQNNLQELMSVLAFIMPDTFADCQEDFDLIFNHRAKTADTDHGALLSARRIARAKSMLMPFILRRTKAQVMKDLPKKIKRVEYCGMTPRQEEFYAEYAEMHNQALAARKAGLTTEGTQHLVYRRQAAIHPLLLPRNLYTDSTIEKMWPKIPREKGKYKKYVSDEGMREHLQWKSDFQLHLLCHELPQLKKFALKNDEWMDSGKVDRVIGLIKGFTAEGSRVLLFSHFTSVLDILEKCFDDVGITRRRIDGATPVNDRQSLIDDFYGDESINVFMLSTRSGGAGINLACANKVIIFDSGFNPQDDIQAENRAHRIGQTRDVEVVTLITKGTIEEQIYALGESKRLLDDRVTGGEDTDDVKAAEKAEKKAMDELERLLIEKGSKEIPKEAVKDEEAEQNISAHHDLKDAFRNGLKARGVTVADS